MELLLPYYDHVQLPKSCVVLWAEIASHMWNAYFRAGSIVKKMPAQSWYSADYRARASTLYKECNFNASMAGAKLGVERHGRAPKRAGQFCMRQYQKEQQHGSVGNQPIPGRPSKVPKKLVSALVAKLVVPADSAWTAMSMP